MKELSESEFFQWAKTFHMDLDERHPPPQCLVYADKNHLWAYWDIPREPHQMIGFFESLLSEMESWQYGRILPRNRDCAYWPLSQESLYKQVHQTLLHSLSLREGYRGPLEFSRSEIAELVAFLYLRVTLGESRDHDLFFVPDHGKQLMWIQHNVIQITFPEAEFLDIFAKRLEEKGYRQ